MVNTTSRDLDAKRACIAQYLKSFTGTGPLRMAVTGYNDGRACNVCWIRMPN